MPGIGEQCDRVGDEPERDLQQHQRNVERGYDRERETEVLGRVTVPVIVRMPRMMMATLRVFGGLVCAMMMLTVIVLTVIVLTVVMIVLVRGHAQP
jgi:hypothetical protein